METKEPNLYCLYELYRNYKLLYEFHQKFRNIKNEDDIRNRIEYIKKNKVKQRNELETLLWVINEMDIIDE